MANRKKGGSTAEAVWSLCEPIVNSLGLELWDVRYLKEGAQWYLRVFIDKQEGVTIEDCENVSRAIDEPLDQLDPVDLRDWNGNWFGQSTFGALRAGL